MRVSLNLTWKDAFIGVWLLALLACLTLVFGSYAEQEAQAGKMFAIMCAVMLALGYPLFRWRNK